MSFIFEINGETVWSPALDVGTANASCAQAFSATVGADAGLTSTAEDFLEIDAATFESYVRALLALASNSDHPVMIPLIDAVLIPSLVMRERAGRPIGLGADPAPRQGQGASRHAPLTTRG